MDTTNNIIYQDEISEVMNELYSTISPYTSLGEIDISNIHLLAEYFIQRNLGTQLYEELKYQIKNQKNESKN